MNKFMTELKRRNVFKVGLAYVVVSWAILQFVDIIQDPMSLPEWFPRVTIVLLGIGLPVALLMSWAYEVTPDGVKKTEDVDKYKSITSTTGHKINKLIIGALALAIAFIAYDKLIDPAPGGGDSDSDVVREASIAVLPFADLSADGDQQYFGDGIAEEILNVLAKVPDLKVAGRTSSFKFKGQNEDLRLIGQQLDVAHVLEGSIRKDGNKIRITVQLIAADDGFHLWSETYDRDLVDIFAIQDQISEAVVEALLEQFGATPEIVVEKETNSSEAYSLYLRGRQLLHLRGVENLEKAAKLFEAVTVLDPDFDEAWVAMARAYGLIPLYSAITGPEVERIFKNAKAAANRAIALNPKNAEAYSALTYINISQLDWADAEKNNLMATTLNPNNAEIANFAGDYYRATGDVINAIKWEKKAYDLDPLHAVNSADMAATYFEFNRPSEGLPFAENAIKTDPDYSFVYQALSYILADLGRFEESRDAIEKATKVNQEDYVALEMRAYLALKEGKIEDVRKYLLELEQNVEAGQGAPALFFRHFLAIGDLEKGLYWYERAYAIKDPYIIATPRFLPENYTDDPAIIARFEVPGMKELFDIRRANMARNAEGAE